MRLGDGLGLLLGRIAVRRMAIAKRNLSLCFPDQDPKAQTKLLRDFAKSMGRSFFEIGIAWFAPLRRIERLHTVKGLEHLEKAQSDRQGVLLVALHFAHLDLGAACACRHIEIDASYRAHKNPVYDYIQAQRRQRHNQAGYVIKRGDVRTIVRRLKAGATIWYAPDQEYGAKHSTFVPFFGVEAATITATSQFARLGKAKVIPFTFIRNDKLKTYELEFLPPLEPFPTDDEKADAIKVNEVVEAGIRLAPEQYLWAHRRFKTRPEGEADLYQAVGIKAGKRG